ncbi:MAG: ribulose-phosphate 3-epimerase, partial [Clostridiales Family XIII bacterium]|nr:ribulose-phosphate 3-epimerase [Clostridiales Family XIII bacterium]
KTLDKARALSETRRARGLDFKIQVDGGVNMENAKALAQAGVDIFVAGVSVFRAKDIGGWVRGFLERARQGASSD